MARAITEKYSAPLTVGSSQHHHHPKQQQPYLFQEILPTEIWRFILAHVLALDLFSLYNTSRYLRSLSAPYLVQAIASKSLRLYFYQEYVRRVGVKFVFDSFDLERDRVVFRPLVADNQYRFRTGITLQSPQLEEVAIKSSMMPGQEIDMRRVQCDQGRYYTIKPATVHSPAPAPSAAGEASQDASQQSQADGVELVADEDMEVNVDLGADGPGTPEAAAVVTETATITTTADTVTNSIITTAAPQSIQTISATRKRVADEKSYQGTKNFLDKSCPVPVRKTGIRKMDGTRYSFLQTYPWSLEYQVESEVMGPLVTLEGERRSGNDGNRNGKGKAVDYEDRNHIGDIGSSSSRVGGKSQSTTDSQRQFHHHQRPQDEIECTPHPYERIDSNGSSSSGGSRSDGRNISSCDNTHSNVTTTVTAASRRRANSPEMADKIAGKSAQGVSARMTHHQGSAGNNSNSSSNNGPRFLRTLRFECSMNFLDPKRATRSVLGRWLEGKMYQWSKVLGGKKTSSGQSRTIQWQSTLKHSQPQPQPQPRQQQQKLQEKQKGKQTDHKQKQPSSTSALYRRLQQQEKQIRQSGNTESGGSGATSPPVVTPVAPPRRRGRVIRAIDILLGPTDSDGSSISHERVRQHSINSPFHTQPPSLSGSNASLSLSLSHQGDASNTGGRCMIPAIDLNKIGSSSTSATF
ncbi:hypothetical protein BG015_009531 [Linnemannia schmuckeri]|uniref:F-box domain-containing protein n=1 Tax=Linnemannia schmuckeri TaxID=64567 RepID=A0A9P5RYX8_9FUNG|nr:hypothetical protein BG015_009531 [Linnemannia schmuckeri]